MPISADLSKQSNVVKNDVVKKTWLQSKLVAKVNNIDTSDFVLKIKYQTDKTKLENKILDTSCLVKKRDYNKNTKITEIEGRISDASNLATKTALTTVETKIPSVSNLVKKTDYNTKVTEIENKLNNHNHGKYIDTPEFNKLAADVFNTRIAQADLITKTQFDAKLLNLNRKITANKSKHLLVKNEFNKLKTFDSSYFIGKSDFDEDGTQNYLVFQPMHKHLKFVNINNEWYITSSESKGLSEESIKPPVTSDNRLNPLINYYYNDKIRAQFTGTGFKQYNLIGRIYLKR